MSKSHAWNAYNEATRKANADYEESVKPLRVSLAKGITAVEKKFDEQIVPLQIEQKENVEMLKAEYAEAVMNAKASRRAAIKSASDVLNAERKAEKSAAAVA